MITKIEYLAIHNWLQKKSWKHFKTLFILGFELKAWQKPLWKCWRIVRNTWITKKYYEIYDLSIDKLKEK